MIHLSWWWLVVDALACYRLTHLIVVDRITRRLRLAAGRWELGAALVACPWCVSAHLGWIALLLTVYVPGVWVWVAVPAALSAVAGYLSERA